MSNATQGFNPLGLRSFEIAVSTTSAPANGTALAAGAYELTASVDLTVLIGTGNITATKLSATATQPAAGSPNRLVKLAAGQSKMIEIVGDSYKIAAITDSASGWLSVVGPSRRGSLP